MPHWLRVLLKDNPEIALIGEPYPCYCKDELNARERYYILRVHGIVNKMMKKNEEVSFTI